MKIKGGLLACAVSLLSAYSVSAQAVVVIGTYSFENNQLVNQVNSVNTGGMLYDGTNLVDPVASPINITDTNAVSAGATFLSTLPSANATGANGVTIGLGFGANQINNPSGNDLALFFLFDQAGNTIDVTINGITNQIASFANVLDGSNVVQVADNVIWNGGTLNNVMLTVAELELTDFGIASGGVINSLSITMTQSEIDPSQVAALSLVGSLNAAAVVPVPAAVWLFGSGLLGLVGVARRKK